MGNHCTTAYRSGGAERLPHPQKQEEDEERPLHDDEVQLATAKPPREHARTATQTPSSPGRSNHSCSAGRCCSGARNAVPPGRLIGSNFTSTVTAPGASVLSTPCEAQPVALCLEDDGPAAASEMSHPGTPTASGGSRRSSAASSQPSSPQVTFTSHALVVDVATDPFTRSATSLSSLRSMASAAPVWKNDSATATSSSALLEANHRNVALVPLRLGGTHNEQRAKAKRLE